MQGECGIPGETQLYVLVDDALQVVCCASLRHRTPVSPSIHLDRQLRTSQQRDSVLLERRLIAAHLGAILALSAALSAKHRDTRKLDAAAYQTIAT